MSDARPGLPTDADYPEIEPALQDALLAAISGPAPSARRLAKLRARVLDAAGQPPVAIFKLEEDAFKPLFPGVRIRPLRMDPVANSQTSLWRLEPGAVIPSHDHLGEEECLIMEGSIVWNDREYTPGDFLLARPGAHHEPFVSPNGCLLMIRSELTPFIEKLFLEE
ncbi:cupin domain-containing protein [Pseudomarimonas salicorniae]|uniref:Cupin domain-containing protein n=1 Tax=Pseudomarimonas salicorniae TaxID=2933270 RepID=A0ABT0GHQ3_9GAMM|nr:cupin domain-containing protein [Lysobacter sp. CAU 1642]MCK7594080.1 cupin domain-containing protein [Lysobacter sp. CAU 1642]